MFHWIDVVRKDSGPAIPDWQVECVQLADGETVVPIFADENETPISSVSGVVNRAVTDTEGNYDFYVPDGTYSLRFYDDAGVLQGSERFLPMYGNETDDLDAAISDAEAARDEAQALIGTIGVVPYENLAEATDNAADGDKFTYLDGSMIVLAEKAGGVISELTGPYLDAEKIGVPSGATVQDEFGRMPNTTGSATSASVIALASHGDSLAGRNPRDTYITKTGGGIALEQNDAGGGARAFGQLLERMTVRPQSLSTSSGNTVTSNKQAYDVHRDVEYHSSLDGAANWMTGNVGRLSINQTYQRGKFGVHYFNPDLATGNTYQTEVRPVYDALETAIHNQGDMRSIIQLNPLFQNVNAVHGQNGGELRGYRAFGAWFEGVHPDRVDLTGGTLGIDATKDGNQVSDGANMPVFYGAYVASGLNFTGTSQYPKIYDAHIAAAGLNAIAKMAPDDGLGRFDLSFTTSNHNALGSSFGFETVLPQDGYHSTPDETTHRTGRIPSIAAESIAGLVVGSAPECLNINVKRIDNTAFAGGLPYWPFQTALGGTLAITGNEPDMFGLNEGVLIANGYVGTSDIAAIGGGGVYFSAVAAIETTSDDQTLFCQLYVANPGGSVEAWGGDKRFIIPKAGKYLIPLRWKIPTNAGANYRLRIGTDGSTIRFDRVAFNLGPNIPLPLIHGQSIAQPFKFENGNVTLFNAIEAATKFQVGDRLEYQRPAAGGDLAERCVVEGSYSATDATNFKSEGALAS